MTSRYKLIAFSMIAIGVVFAILGFSSGGKWYILKDRSGFYVPKEQTLAPQLYELDAFKNINLSNEHADIEILPSDRYALEVIAFETTDVTHVVKDDTLTIKSNNRKERKMTIGFGPFRSPSIKIYVPREASLSHITIDSSFGDVDLKNMKYAQFNLNMSYGDVSFQNIHSGQTEITNEFGDLSFQQFTSGRLGITSEYGDIDIAGELNGKTTIYSSFGDVELQLRNNRSELGLNLSTSFGDLTVNGKEYGTKLSQPNDEENQLDVSLSEGDLDLTFN